MLRICVAGATGWTGSDIAHGVLAAEDLELASAVSRSAAGGDLGEALGREPLGVPVHGTVAEALDGVDVLIDYTSPTAVKANTLTAIEAGVAVVIGTSGLTAADFARDRRGRPRARRRRRRRRQLLADRRDGPGRRAARRAPPAAVGDPGLRERDEARRAERHRARAGRAPRGGARPGARAAARRDPRPARGARRDRRRRPGALRPPAELRRLHGGRLRAPRRAARHPPRRRRHAGARTSPAR